MTRRIYQVTLASGTVVCIDASQCTIGQSGCLQFWDRVDEKNSILFAAYSAPAWVEVVPIEDGKVPNGSRLVIPI